MFMAAKDYFAYFFIGPYIAIFRNIRSDLGLVSARVLVGGSAGGDSHCFYNQYILPIICSDRFDQDRKSTRLNSSHSGETRMPSSA